MQRGNDPDKLTGTNSNINSNPPSNNSNHPRTSTAANSTGAMSDLNATSSYQQQGAPATALRANRQNPGGADSAVAEPSIGGVATPYNSANIEAAKQHLVDSLNGTHIDSKVDHSNNNNKSVTSTLASGATSVATGAAAAGAAALTAAKKLVSHDDESKSETGASHPNQTARMPSYAKDIPSSTASTTTLYGSPFPTDHDASTSSTGTTAARDTSSSQSRTAAPLSASSMHSNLQSEHQSLGTARSTGLSQNPTTPLSSSVPMSTDSQQLHHKNNNAVSGSMKGREVSTAGVMGATSALFAAPPMKDTVTSTTDIPPTAPGQASASSNMSMGSHGPSAMGAATAGAGAAAYNANKSQQASNNLATSNKDADLLKTHRAERRPSIADKVKNVFRRRSSAVDLDNDNIETGNFRANTLGAPNNETTIKHRKSSGLNSREMATAAAAAAKIQAATAAGPHSHRVNKTVNELSQQGSKIAPDSPQLTSSGAPKADLHATSGIPATKIDAVPTTTLNQGYHNPKAHDVDASQTAAATGHPHDSKMDTRPLKEKISAPLMGTAVAGTTAAYAGHRASTGKEISRDSMDQTHSDHNPMHMFSTAPSASTTLGKSGMNASTDHGAHTGTSTTSHPTSPTRPLAEKVKAPMVGAAAAVTGLGNKIKETVSNVTHRRSSADANKVATNNPTTRTAGMGTTMPSTAPYSSGSTGPTIASSHATPAIGAATGAGASMAARDMSNRDMSSRDTLGHDNNLHTSSVAPVNTTTHVTPSTTSTTAPQSNMSAGKLGAASALSAAAAGTAAYATHKPSAPSHTMNTSNTTGYNNSINTNTNTNTAGYNNTINTHNSTLNTPATTSTKIGADDISVADKIAAAIPSSFHGTVPRAGPGEEVVWVKTVTTTEYYDTKDAKDTVGNVVETRQDDVHPSGVVEQRGGGRHM
ncbi:hypothetical protein BGZ70_008695 [Mortierella alpina]|uniref:Uncharacterized protein n=1 Tax=Mortierella alpina TaxID=64518 RepID=A0A9P6M170_MORAP|nr:hypothetical protein BGZ70_008695 [Mortierella alpina]